MNQTHYPFQYAREEKLYVFFSEGRRGKIKKVVQFKLIDENVFNMGFGDANPQTGVIDDQIVSDNGDMEIIIIAMHHQPFIAKFEIFGLKDNVWECFAKNVGYESFLISELL